MKDEDDPTPLRWGLGIASILSLMGSSFIIFSYLRFPRLRSTIGLLIFMLSVSDFGSSVGAVLIFALPNYTLCKIQAIFIQYFDVSGFLWSACIAFHAYQAINNRKSEDELRLNLKYYPILCYLLPLALAIIPLFFGFDSYGQSESAWCWIADHKSDALTYVRFVVYYIPLILIWIYNASAYVIIRRKLARTYSPATKSASQRMTLYVLVFVVTKFPGLINRLTNIISPSENVFWLFWIQSVLSPMQGFLNSLIYGMRDKLRNAYRAWLTGMTTGEGEDDEVVNPETKSLINKSRSQG